MHMMQVQKYNNRYMHKWKLIVLFSQSKQTDKIKYKL
jgi:hypothetical protein